MNRKIFNVLNSFGVISFVIFAWLQHEDNNAEVYFNPSVMDVWMWMIFYGLVAFLFGLAIRKLFPKLLYLLFAFFCSYQLSVTIPGFMANLTSGSFSIANHSMSPVNPQVELTREFLGTLIALAAVGFLWWQRGKTRKILN
ncbi:transmembrane 220 family protein [Crocosphaera chwakensis]|uniref:Uncharacterized protein n=1 Tax=Crocosphaera chwakensis CCY0110 TaxID=391612 RepID=A3IVG9_9CHRO|nr:transmembrane 220 family protein [Crocosphaera chwakensis]EAZ89541.1 hypothetical protein CY0110_09231 [Crocosphaera chwakensis CCY0110]